jgi:rare lipoprotein A
VSWPKCFTSGLHWPHGSLMRAAGRVAEWFKAAVLKTARGATLSWVRIPPLPPSPLVLRNLGPRLAPAENPRLTMSRPTSFPPSSGRDIINRWVPKGNGRAARSGIARCLGDIMRRNGILADFSMIARIGAVAGCCLTLANCGSNQVDPKYGVSASPRVVQRDEPVPKGGGTYRVGKPYNIGGQIYSPEENVNYSAEGRASWYGENFHGRRTANGEIFDMESITAAHPTLPIPSYARVTNLANNRSIIVRVNDRGPFHQGRLIDVSVRTAKLLGFHQNGVARVRVDYVGRAALEGSDDTKLAATLRRGTPAPGPVEVRMASAQPLPPGSQRPPERHAVLNMQARSSNARFVDAANLPPMATRGEPVSVIGRPAPDAPSAAVVSGRGLY